MKIGWIRERDEYISNPDTRVIICYNNELSYNRWVYSVQVQGTEFWLNSFEALEDAIEFIKNNNLKFGDTSIYE